VQFEGEAARTLVADARAAAHAHALHGDVDRALIAYHTAISKKKNKKRDKKSIRKTQQGNSDGYHHHQPTTISINNQ